MPKVSVVIPTYNRAHLIGEAIQSVLDQTFQDFELIVVDDGSTDNTREVVDSFKDPRIKYIYQENQGSPAARNTGIKASKGEYIAFLDSDDMLLKSALEKGVEVLNRHPEVAFSYGQKYIIDQKGRVVRLPKRRLKYSCIRQGWEELRDYLLFGSHPHLDTLMVRRSCLDEVGLFDPAFRSGSQDLELWVRLAKRYAAAYIAEPLAKFREHPGKFCSSRSLQEWEKTNSSIIESICNDIEFGELLGNLRATAYFHLYLNHCGRAYNRGDSKTARDYLHRALTIRPKGFFKSLWLPWIYQFAKTWIPLPVLHSLRRAKRYLLAALWRHSTNSTLLARRISGLIRSI